MNFAVEGQVFYWQTHITLCPCCSFESKLKQKNWEKHMGLFIVYQRLWPVKPNYFLRVQFLPLLKWESFLGGGLVIGKSDLTPKSITTCQDRGSQSMAHSVYSGREEGRRHFLKDGWKNMQNLKIKISQNNSYDFWNWWFWNSCHKY